MSSPKQFTDCICPRCTDEDGNPTKHRMRLYWSGKLPARKYCWWCNKAVEEYSKGISPINLTISGRDVCFHMSKREGS